MRQVKLDCIDIEALLLALECHLEAGFLPRSVEVVGGILILVGGQGGCVVDGAAPADIRVAVEQENAIGFILADQIDFGLDLIAAEGAKDVVFAAQLERRGLVWGT